MSTKYAVGQAVEVLWRGRWGEAFVDTVSRYLDRYTVRTVDGASISTHVSGLRPRIPPPEFAVEPETPMGAFPIGALIAHCATPQSLFGSVVGRKDGRIMVAQGVDPSGFVREGSLVVLCDGVDFVPWAKPAAAAPEFAIGEVAVVGDWVTYVLQRRGDEYLVPTRDGEKWLSGAALKKGEAYAVEVAARSAEQRYLAACMPFTLTDASGKHEVQVTSGAYQHPVADRVDAPAVTVDAPWTPTSDDWTVERHSAPGANATCARCGGPAFHGLNDSTCLRATGCGPEPLPEPDEVYSVLGVTNERGWCARGRGTAASHPLRDEAVRLWRERVSAKPLAVTGHFESQAALVEAIDREIERGVLGSEGRAVHFEPVGPAPGKLRRPATTLTADDYARGMVTHDDVCRSQSMPTSAERRAAGREATLRVRIATALEVMGIGEHTLTVGSDGGVRLSWPTGHGADLVVHCDSLDAMVQCAEDSAMAYRRDGMTEPCGVPVRSGS